MIMKVKASPVPSLYVSPGLSFREIATTFPLLLLLLLLAKAMDAAACMVTLKSGKDVTNDPDFVSYWNTANCTTPPGTKATGKCSGADIRNCKNVTCNDYNCESANIVNVTEAVECNGEGACSDALINAPNTTTSIKCMGKRSCKGAYISHGIQEIGRWSTFINCMGEEACKGAYISEGIQELDRLSTPRLMVNCTGTHACANANIYNPVNVTCQGLDVCMSANITNVTQSVNCLGLHTCHQTKIFSAVPKSEPISEPYSDHNPRTINCNGTYACYKAEIAGTPWLDINCAGMRACDDIEAEPVRFVKCANGTADGHACSGNATFTDVECMQCLQFGCDDNIKQCKYKLNDDVNDAKTASPTRRPSSSTASPAGYGHTASPSKAIPPTSSPFAPEYHACQPNSMVGGFSDLV